MFNNLFSSSPLVWAGLIAGFAVLPILIHLINLLRHRRVKWAAMDFLLKSYKKRRNWVRLKQFLLLAARVAAMLLALFMLGQVGCDNERIASLVGSNVTHHYVLLDDSFSMEDRVGESRVFDRARNTLLSIASRAKDRQNQRFTILRFSRAAALSDEPTSDGGEPQPVADLNGEAVDSEFESRVEAIRSKLECSNLSVGPSAAIQTVAQMINAQETERAIVYLVSDFREKDWSDATELQSRLESLNSTGTDIKFIQCARNVRNNLAITGISIDGNIRVAGFPLMMNVSVKNFGQKTAEKVQIKIDSFEFAAARDMNQGQPDAAELPTVFVDRIEPGETETRKFVVFFRSPGQHLLHVRLGADALADDNSRWQTVQVFPSSPVLLIDGLDRANSRLLSMGLEPNNLTGIKSDIRSEDFLRDAAQSDLDVYDSIMLTDIGKLSESSVKNLEAYVANGGGLGIFCGPETDYEFYNRALYRDGEGLLPMPLDRKIEIPELGDEKIPNVGTTSHPIMGPFVGLKTSPLERLQIFSALQPAVDWSADDDDSVEIAATIRGQIRSPLVVTRRFGNGNVALITTTVAPIWNNWIRNESFPLFALMLQDWLASGRFAHPEILVGNDLSLSASTRDFRNQVVFTIPTSDQFARTEVKQTSLASQASDDLQEWILNGNTLNGSGTRNPGLYEAWLTGTNSEKTVKRWSVNVDSTEGDLAIASTQNLATQFSKAKIDLVSWNEFDPEAKQANTSNLGKIMLLILLAILVMEQLLAYSASYHPRRSATEYRAA